MADLWKARLLPASFRGIPFFVERHDFVGGRNSVQHEPPNRNSSFAEDMGRKPQGYNITGHILGDNYFFIRDALISAMETEDSGILVHPYLGVKEVQPGQFTFTEDTSEGRICTFQLNFTEAGDPSFPIAFLDSVTDFVTSVVATVAIVQNAFQLAYSVSQLPGFARESAKALLNDFSTSVRANIAGISGDDSNQASLNKRLNDFDSNAEVLAANPASLAGEVNEILSLVRDLPQDPPDSSTVDIVSGRDEKLDALFQLATFDSDNADVEETTPTREREKDNADAIVNLVRQLAVIKLAENAIEKDFKSLDEAIAIRDQIIDLIEEQLSLESIEDDTFKTLSIFKAKVVSAIPVGDLASVETIELLQTLPSIVVTYDLYESPDNEGDLIDRNKIENPQFVSGEIEVLRVG